MTWSSGMPTESNSHPNTKLKEVCAWNYSDQTQHWWGVLCRGREEDRQDRGTHRLKLLARVEKHNNPLMKTSCKKVVLFFRSEGHTYTTHHTKTHTHKHRRSHEHTIIQDARKGGYSRECCQCQMQEKEQTEREKGRNMIHKHRTLAVYTENNWACFGVDEAPHQKKKKKALHKPTLSYHGDHMNKNLQQKAAQLEYGQHPDITVSTHFHVKSLAVDYAHTAVVQHNIVRTAESQTCTWEPFYFLFS